MPDTILDPQDMAVQHVQRKQPQCTRTVVCRGIGKRMAFKESETLNKAAGPWAASPSSTFTP